ncbi:MAG: PaaI family thioesterase [Aggregatilineales bacterium]
MIDPTQPVQNFYAEESSICYGCGRNNVHGHHIQSYWDGETGTANFMPEAYHTAYPGYVYGGLLASLIDCHCIGTAIAAMFDLAGRDIGTEPQIVCVTGNLNVDFLKPTPTGVELILKSRVEEINERKAVIVCDVYAGDTTTDPTVRGKVVAVRVKSRMTM